MKYVLLSMFALFLSVGEASAVGYCPDRPGGKCPAKSQLKPDSSKNYSAEERAKMREEFRVLCKKQYGAQSQLYRVDYYRRKYICT